MSINDQNKLLWFSFTTNFFAGIAFFGTISTLVLFLVDGGTGYKTAYGVWQSYDVLIYLLSLLGGFFVGRIMPFRFASLVGIGVACLGYFLLAIYAQHSISIIKTGLAFVSCGAGIFGTNLKNILSLSFQKKFQRYRGFNLLHLSDLLGQVSGPLLLSWAKLHSENLMFLVAALSTLISFICFATYYKKIEITKLECSTKKSAVIFMACLLLLSIGIMHSGYVGYFLSAVLFGLLLFLAKLTYQSSSLARHKIMGLFCLMFGMLVASICLRQITSILNLFTQNYIDREIAGFLIPTGFFQSIEPFIVVLFTPLFIIMWRKLDQINKMPSTGTLFSIGLGSLAFSFFGLVIGTHFPGTIQKVDLYWLVVSYVFMASAELLILPIGLVAVAELSPEKWRGFFMSAWMILVAIATYLNGYIGKIISPSSGVSPTFISYQALFTQMAFFALISAFLMFVGWKIWQKRYFHLKHDLAITLSEAHYQV